MQVGMDIHIFTFRKTPSIGKHEKTIFRVIIFRKIILIILAQENFTRRSGYTRILIVIQGEFIEVADIKL